MTMKNSLFLVLLVFLGCNPAGPTQGASSGLENQAIYSLNFDDGYASAYNSGMPIVEAAGYKTTQFIITGSLTNPAYVTADQVLKMQDSGHEIAAHTRTHPHLSTLPVDQQQNEIQGSYNDLCSLLGHCPTDFAYPYGDLNAITIATVQQTGFLSARIIRDSYNSVSLDQWQLAAYAPDSTTQFSDVQKFIDGAYDQKVWAILVIHRVDEDGNPISIRHELFQDIIDYLKHKNVKVVTQSQAFHLMGMRP
jgi:peptidoglycan/xylan/chitin deacetylase (PgdA/CDA1 family)